MTTLISSDHSSFLFTFQTTKCDVEERIGPHGEAEVSHRWNVKRIPGSLRFIIATRTRKPSAFSHNKIDTRMTLKY